MPVFMCFLCFIVNSRTLYFHTQLPAAAGGSRVNGLRKLCYRDVTCILLRMIDRISHFAAF